MQFVTHHNIDIVCIQGTRWTMQREWSTHGYWVLSTRVEDSRDQGGLLTLISHRLCSSQDISSASPIQGRVQRVKCRVAEVTLELIQVYQFPTDVTSTRAHPYDSRATVWSTLDQVLHAHPQCSCSGRGL